jgi:PD-(D/E)XK endonuclease
MGNKRKPRIIQDKKLRGEWAESVFMARAGEQGLAVSKPWGESRSYDFVVRGPGGFVSVQVKSTTVAMGGGYSCAVRKQNERYRRGAFDFLAAYVIPEDAWYIIPLGKFAGRATLILCSNSAGAKYEKYREAWSLLREASQIPEQSQENADAGSESVAAGGEPAAKVAGGPQSPGNVLGRMQATFNFVRQRLERGAALSQKRDEEE